MQIKIHFVTFSKNFKILHRMKKKDSEFRVLMFLYFVKFFEINETDLITVWKSVFELKSGDGAQFFPTISKFNKKILTLPHSSGNVEIVIS